MAIDRALWIALRPREDRAVVIDLLDFDRRMSFSLEAFSKGESGPVEYVKGVAWALQEAGETLQGWAGVLQGDIPIGAGLSSSAALEMAAARAFAAVSGVEWDAKRMAKLGQRAENEWVGVNCGIMDQMISAAGREEHALLIDCHTLETALAPLPPDTVVVVLDTGTRRGLVGSAYNERRQQCEAAAQFFGVPALRDIEIGAFETRAAALDEVTRRRARHVITENDRTRKAQDTMTRGDTVMLGKLMDASHRSLRDDFEVSSEALNAIVKCAHQHPACYGARMTGAGFGGCAVALIEAEAAADFATSVEQCYSKYTDHTPQIYITQASNGAEIDITHPLS